jgi:type IV protein arginine methyltransferase
MISKEYFLNSKAELKDGILLLNKKWNLMEVGEKKEIKKLIRDICKRYKPKRVLEIGFGLGYTATEFQKFNLQKHIIIEAHPEIFKTAMKWSKKYKNVSVINCFLQDFNYDTKDYDLIFDDRQELVYPVKDGVIFPNYKLLN